MAAIDSLLRLIDSQQADVLKLVPEAAPVLLVGGEERPLSMPPVAREMVEAFVAEMRPGDADPTASSFGYQAEDLGAFKVQIRELDGQLSAVVIRKRGKKTPGATPGAGGGVPSAAAAAVAAAASMDTFSGAVVGQGSSGVHGDASASFGPAASGDEAPAQASPTPVSAATASPAPMAGLPADDPAVVALLELLRQALIRQASDLFLSTGQPATLRVDRQLVVVPDVYPTDPAILGLLAPQLPRLAQQRLAEHGSADFSFVLGDPSHPESPRFRVSLFRHAGGLGSAFRPVRQEIPSLEALRLPPGLTSLVGHQHGLVLMTGATGSGKSTTLAALVSHLNQTAAKHIITIEDPIEHRYPSRRCLIHQRELGAQVTSFADGVRAALRGAPDVILVGEMRDPETISAALTAAETGHLVLSTLHTGTAALAVDRIVDGFAQSRQQQVRLQLAAVLRSVVSQRLLPTRHGGLVPALEILHVTSAVAALIREGHTHQLTTSLQTGRDAGMVPLERALADLVTQGLVDRATALETAGDPEFLTQLLRH